MASSRGTLEKSFRGARGTVMLESRAETTTDPARADEVIAELTGIPTEAFFRSTASVRHHELDGLARDEAALRDRLQASISGADRGTSRSLKKLEKALFELNTKGEKNPGKVKAAEAMVAQETAAQRNGEAALEQLEHDRDALVHRSRAPSRRRGRSRGEALAARQGAGCRATAGRTGRREAALRAVSLRGRGQRADREPRACPSIEDGAARTCARSSAGSARPTSGSASSRPSWRASSRSRRWISGADAAGLAAHRDRGDGR